MEIRGNNAVDETVVYFDPTATDGYNTTTDGIKILASLPGIPSIFTIADNQNLAINVLGNLNFDRYIPLGVFIQTGGQYNLVATDFSSFGPSAMIYLEDAVAGTMQNLRVNNTYSVQLAPGTYTNRFFLRIHPPLILTGIIPPCSVDLAPVYGIGKIVASFPSDSLTAYIQIEDENGNIFAMNIDPSSGWPNGFNGTDTLFFMMNSGNYKATIIIDSFTIEEYVTIPENNHIEIDLNATSLIIYVGEPIIFYSNIINGTLHSWDFGDGNTINSTNATNVSHVYTQTGNYNVILNSSNGICNSTDSLNIQVVGTSGFFNNQTKSVEIILDRTTLNLVFTNTQEPKGDVNIYDITGRLTKRFRNVQFNGTQSFDITDINSGNYIVTIGNSITRMICTIN